MRTRILWLLLGLLLVGMLALGGIGVAHVQTSRASGITSGEQSIHSQGMSGLGVTHVFMRNDIYQPSHIQVSVGTVVTWTNEDDVPHGVTIAHSVVSTGDNWESGLLSTGQSFSYVFTSPGTYTYYCSEHPSVMTGVVVVMG